jgi:predicted ATPase/DNA-binding winged helix-turn-helix (wHTH) protein
VTAQRHRFGRHELDVGARRLSCDGVEVPLQPKAMELLVRLVAAGGSVLPRAEIDAALWPDTTVTDNSLRQVVHRLREVLGAGAIETLPRVGLRFGLPIEAAAPPAPALPPERDAFVGRVADLAALEQLADAPLVTLVGTGGVGKTRLALRHARAWAATTGAPAWFCELADARTAEDVLGTVASALDVPFVGRDAADRVRHAIAGRGRCLVILDNFEQVEAGARTLVAAWAAEAPSARFLVTSRVPLDLSGERRVEVQPLPEADGVALLRTRCRGARAGSPEAELELVRRLDGLPLAIELAAGRIEGGDPAALLARLDDRFAVLAAPGADGRHATLLRALTWSWALLADDEQRVLAQLSVFAGGFRTDAAEAVVESPERWVGEVVAGLCASSLVQATAGDRFELLISVREFAASRLEPPEARAVEVRHGAWFGALGSAASIAALHGPGGTARRLRWREDLDNLIAAARRAVARGDAAVAAGAALAVAEVARRSGRQALAIELLDQAAALDGLADPERLRVALAAGVAALHVGDGEVARVRLDAASAFAGADPGLDAEVLQARAQLAHDGGDPRRAGAHIEAALALVTGLGDEGRTARLLATAGGIALHQGRAAQAVDAFGEARAVFRAAGDLANEARACLNLAVALGMGGEIERSGATYREALALVRHAGDRYGTQAALSGLGAWSEKVGQGAEAAAYLSAAATLARELGDRRGEGIALGNLGRQPTTADPRRHLERALQLHRAIGFDYGQANWLCGLARLALGEGRTADAVALADEAVARAERYPDALAGALAERARIALAEGRTADARVDVTRGQALGPTGITAAELAVAEGRVAVAEGDLASARAALDRAGENPLLADPATDLGRGIAELRARLEAARGR